MRSFLRGAIVFCLVTTMFGQADGAGFGFSEQNVRANGMAGAYSAIADDPSAIFYNPAGLGFLKGLQGTTGVTFAAGRSYYRADRSENNTTSRSRIIPVPHGFGSMEVNELITIGGGVHAPYGLSLEYPAEAETRFSNVLAEVRAQFLSAAVGIRPTKWLSLGAVFHYVTTRRLIPGYDDEGVRIHQKVDLNQSIFEGLKAQLPAGTPDDVIRAQARGIAATVNEPMTRIKGDAWGLGYSLGVLIKPIKEFSFGFTYRSSVNLRSEGADVTFNGVQDPVGLPPGTLTNSLVGGGVETSLYLPPSFSLSVSSQLGDKFTIGVQADWTGWSAFDEVNIRFKKERPVAVRQLETKWHDVWALRVGVEYLVIGNYSDIQRGLLKGGPEPSDEETTEGGFAVAIRAGYFWDESPVPIETLSAFLPDNDRHVINFGVGVDMGWVRLDLSYQYFYFKTVRRDNETEGIDNEILPTQGRFQTQAHLFGAGLTLRF